MWLLELPGTVHVTGELGSARRRTYENRFDETPFGTTCESGIAGWGRTVHITRRTNTLRPAQDSCRARRVRRPGHRMQFRRRRSRPHPEPTAVGASAPGSSTPPPRPSRSRRPHPGRAWTGVHPPKDYRVPPHHGDDRPTKALVKAVEDWAEAEHVDLRTVRAEGTSGLLPTVTKALDMGPDSSSARATTSSTRSRRHPQPSVATVPRRRRGTGRTHLQRHGRRLVGRLVPR